MLVDHLKRSLNDPCYFNEKVLCRSPYWQAQRDWASALVDYRISLQRRSTTFKPGDHIDRNKSAIPNIAIVKCTYIDKLMKNPG